jgi:phenylalanyl-tRNA synthetase beta chain
MDFLDIKGDAEALLAVLGIKDAVFAPSAEKPWMHPGRTAALRCGSAELGYIGELHPDVADNYQLGARAYVADFSLSALFENQRKRNTFVPPPKFPAVTRDLALQVKPNVLAAEIDAAVKENAGPLLESLTLFDVYQGKQVESGYKSMAYSLTFRAADRSLTDGEVSEIIQKILAHLHSKLNIALRDK